MGGVQQVMLGISLSLQLNPLFVEIDLDLANAHTFSSRDKSEKELESDNINRIYVQPSARVGWIRFLDTVPMNATASLPIHNISDGSSFSDPTDPDRMRL